MKYARLRFALSALAAISVAGCGGGDGGSGTTSAAPTPMPTATPTPTVAQRVATLEAQGSLPTLDRTSSVAGPDANTNGVRDDVDAYITGRNLPDTQRAAAVQLAQASQRMVTVDPTNKAMVEQVNLADARAVKCAFSRFAGTAAPSQIAEDIEKVTANTKARLLAYLRFAKASDGAVLPSPEGNTCD